MNHYTYMLTSGVGSTTPLFYIGVRSSNCDPIDDIQYMSSSKLVESMLISGVKFNEHPDFLKEYYPTTGTRTYWSGRNDKLMSDKISGEKKYYKTDMNNIDGTPIERVEILMSNHYISGQFMPVLQEIQRLAPLLQKDNVLSLLSKYSIQNDHAFMINWFKKHIPSRIGPISSISCTF